MAELAALSLACNIFQVISFAHETYNFYQEIKDSGTLDPLVLENATQMIELGKDLEAKINNYTQPVTKEQQTLSLYAQKCLKISKKLQEDVTPSTTGGRVGKALKASLRRSSIARHKAQLLELQQSMQMQILGDSWIRDQATIVEQQNNFNNLDKQLQDFITKVATGHIRIDELIQREATAIQSHTAREGARIRDHIAQEFQLKELNTKCEKLLQSLEFPEMNSRRNQRSINAYEKTFLWAFKDEILSDEDEMPFEKNGVCPWDSFPSFLTTKHNNLYWISGKPGSGKSTLMKFLVNHPQTKELLGKSSSNPLIISYFLWKSGSPMQRNIKGLLASLVHQLIDNQRDILNSFNHMNDLDVWSKKYLGDWSEEALEKLLFQCLQTSAQFICLFIDGLDEVDQYEQPTLIGLIHKIRAYDRSKICVSSRPEPGFRRSYGEFPQMRLQDLTESDIRNYIKKKLEKFGLEMQLDPNERVNKLLQLIVVKAKGVFLWVYLVLEKLRVGIELGDDWSTLMELVETAPSELNGLYSDMWKRFGNNATHYRQEASFYFQYLLHENRADILDFAFMRSKTPRQVIIHGWSIPPLEQLNAECESTLKHIENHTAGLLEVTETVEDEIYPGSFGENMNKDEFSESQWVRFELLARRNMEHKTKSFEIFRRLLKFGLYEKRAVNFIHRSVADFLKDTDEGRELLAYCQLTSRDHEMNAFQSRVFVALVGAPDIDRNFGPILEGFHQVDEEKLNERQIEYIYQFLAKAFYRRLGELDVLRGDNQISGAHNLCMVARKIVDDFIFSAAQAKLPVVIRNYAKFVEAQGGELTNNMKSRVLHLFVDLIPRKSEIWSADRHDLVSWLLGTGADPFVSSAKLGDASYFQLCGPFYQSVSAFEVFVLSVLDLINHGNGTLEWLSLANTLRLFLEHSPDPEKRVLYCQYITLDHRFDSTATGASADTSTRINTFWELTLAQIVKIIVDCLTKECPETQKILLPSFSKWNSRTCSQVRLMLIGTIDGIFGISNYRTVGRLSEPLLIDLQSVLGVGLHMGNASSVSPDACSILEDILDGGEELEDDTAASALLESHGFDVIYWRKMDVTKTDYPTPYHGFDEHYGAPAPSSADNLSLNPLVLEQQGEE